MFKRRRQQEVHGAAVKVGIDINAPADLVWRILVDAESNDKKYRTCVGVKNLNPKKSLNPVEPGAKYADKRAFHGQEMEFVNHVTEVDHTHRRYAEASSIFHCTCTSTMWVDEAESDGCYLSGSYGMVPNGLRGKFYFWRKRNTMLEDGHAAVLMDFEDIKHAAEHGTYKSKDSDPMTERSSTSVMDMTRSSRSR